MKASKLRNGQVVDLFGTLVCLRAIVDQENGVRHLSGQVVRGGGREVTHSVHPESDVPLCNWDGVAVEGKTKAEIEAEGVYKRLTEAGCKAELTIEHENDCVSARVWCEGGRTYDDCFSGNWMTFKTGRKTTRFCHGSLVRRHKGRNERKYVVSMSRKEFYQRLWIVLNLQRMRQARETEAAAN